MNITITKQNKSALPRNEIEVLVTFDGITPNRQELRQKIAAKTNGKENLTIVRSIHTAYGKKEAIVSVYIYDNEDAMKAIEFPKMIEKNKPKLKEEKKEDASEKTPKEAKPVEENKEKATAEPSKDEAKPEEKVSEDKPVEEKKVEPVQETKEKATDEKPSEADNK